MKIAKIYRAAVVAKKHLLYLPLIMLCLWFSNCTDSNPRQNVELANSVASKYHRLHALECGDQLWYEDFYNHVYTLLDTMQCDVELINLSQSLIYDSLDINALIGNGTVGLLEDMPTMQTFNAIVNNYFSMSIDDLGQDESTDWGAILQLIDGLEYITAQQQSEWISSFDLTDGEAAFLCLACAGHNKLWDSMRTCHVMFIDRLNQCWFYDLSKYTYPAINYASTPMVLKIQVDDINNIDWWDKDGVASHIVDGLYEIDTLLFASTYAMNIYILEQEENHTPSTISVQECRIIWVAERSEERELYTETLDHILNSNMAWADKLRMVQLVTERHKQALNQIDVRFDACKQEAMN